MIFDFHAHLTFKPFNSRSIYHQGKKLPDTELWKERFRPTKSILKLPMNLEKEVNYTSQIHLNALAKSDIRCMCVSLYPLERVFTATLKNHRHTIFGEIFSKADDLLFFVDLEKHFKDKFYKAVGTLAGYDYQVVRKIHDGPYHYYNQMMAEYKFLVDHQNKKPAHGKLKYEIANNYTEYHRIVSENKLAVIISAEGMNCFMDESIRFDHHLNNERKGQIKEIDDIYTRHVKDFKSQKHPPFFVTFAHHQYNFLCGHSPSFVGIAEVAFDQGGSTVDAAGKKTHFYDVGIHPVGQKIVKQLLDRQDGRRVLIDTKHMSPAARVDFHDFVKQQRSAGDKIPIIQSHTAVSGRPSMRGISHAAKNLELPTSKARKSVFSSGAINLFDDEIIEIVESDGLMGIMIDEKRIVGYRLQDDTAYYASLLPALHPNRSKPEQKLADHKKLFKKAMFDLVKQKRSLALAELDSKPNREKIKRIEKRISNCQKEVDRLYNLLETIFHSILLNQFLYIVQVVNDASSTNPGLANGKGWDHVCIGTDYEGVINPLDIYYYASDLSKLQSKLVFYWTNAVLNPQPSFGKYRKYLFGQKPEYWINKILWKNADRFLKTYFTDKYLKAK